MTSPVSRLRVVFIGWGAMAQAAARLLEDSPVDIVGVGVRNASALRAAPPIGAQVITEPAGLKALAPDVVAEAAGRASVGTWAPAALAAGADFIVSSASALADEDLLRELETTARSNGCQLHIHPGAVAGIEALSAARMAGLTAVEHRIVKPPMAWLGTPAEALCDLTSLEESIAFYRAPADETASTFPKNANVAMTVALAGIGARKTMVTLVADPEATSNHHELRAEGGFGTLDVAIANTALAENPKTSAMAALSLVRVIDGRRAPVVL